MNQRLCDRPTWQDNEETLRLRAVPDGHQRNEAPMEVSLVGTFSRHDGIVVWIIDDSPTIRAVMEMALRRLGLTVRVFAHGMGALQYARTSFTEPAPRLILVDIELPRMDGYTLIQYLRSCPRLASARIIILSGRGAVLDRVKGRLAGADAYLVKPITSQTLSTILRATCELAEPPAPGALEEPVWSGS